MIDLFDWTPPAGYPVAPGYKENTTSRDAAKAAGLTASQMRDDLMVLYRGIWPAGMTADEAAGKLGRSILTVRPRITELRKLSLLMPALQPAKPDQDAKPMRRPNASGQMATVLVCKRPETP